MTLQAFPRFLLSGAFNTALTYALYLGLLLAFPYWFSYSVAYVTGIVLAYVLSRAFVFGRGLSGRRLLAFPLVYVVQYALGLAITWVWAGALQWPASLAPLAALTVTIPVTFMLTRWVFAGSAQEDRPAAGNVGVPMRRARSATAAFLLLPPLVLLVLLWLPFGFRLGGLIEEWDVLGAFAAHGLFFLATPHSPLAAHALRPLTIFPHAVAYLLQPDSFAAWHLLNLVFLLLKGAAAGFLALAVTRSAGWALATTMLVVVYPADTMQFAFRGLHINAALALLLLAGSFAVAAHYRPTRRGGALAGGVGALLFLAAGLMYETSLALVALPLLVLLAAEGGGRTWRLVRARPEIAAMWAAATLLCVLNAVIVSRAQATYQAAVGGAVLPVVQLTWPRLFTVAAPRALVDGWYDAWNILRQEFGRYTYLLAALLASGGVLLIARGFALRSGLVSAFASEPVASRAVIALRLALCGLVLMLLGYAPYLVSQAHVAITQRTYLFATPGAAFVWLALLFALAGATRVVASAGLAALLVCGLAAQLYQFRHYLAISEQQRTLLRSLVASFPGDLNGRTLIVLDESNRLNHTWALARGNLTNALTYIYGHPFGAVEICAMPSRAWQRLDDLGRPGECMQEAGGWRLRQAAPVSGPGYQPPPAAPDVVIPSAQAVVLHVAPDGSIAPDPSLAAYDEQLAHGDSVVARRYRGVLLPHAPSALLRQFRSERETASYRTDFGRWWSLEEPIHGSGWREADWDITAWHQDASAWTVADDATLVFDLPSPGKTGTMRGAFTALARPNDPVRLRLNGQPVAARWPDPLHFEADVPPGLVRRGGNVLEIVAPVASDGYGLGVKMTRFEIITH